MKTYQTVTSVKAKKMKRRDYYEVINKEMPCGLDGSAKGYYVKHECGRCIWVYEEYFKCHFKMIEEVE